jgi:ABC-type transport system involved in multi-copper enzyme maturation permease subunit
MSLLTTMAPAWTLCLYANLYCSDISQLGLFHALAALAFIHYLKVYIDFRYNRETADLVLLLEMFGISLLASTFVAAWSTMLIVYSRSLAYGY